MTVRSDVFILSLFLTYDVAQTEFYMRESSAILPRSPHNSEKKVTYCLIFLGKRKSTESRCTEDKGANSWRFVEGTYKLQCITEKRVTAEANFLAKFPVSTNRKFHKLNLLLVSCQVHNALGWFGTDSPTTLVELPSRDINLQLFKNS